MNEYYFEQNEFEKNIVDAVSQEFQSDEIFDKLGCSVEINKEPITTVDATSFPYVFIQIGDNSASQVFTSVNQSQHFTNVSVVCDLYTMDTDKYSRRDMAIAIAESLIKVMQVNFGMRCTMNKPLPNLDTNVSRRRVQFNCLYDNINKQIYLN